MKSLERFLGEEKMNLNPTEEEKEFWVLAVKLLFKHIKEGNVELAEGRTPELVKELDAVAFDVNGNPLFETITPLVRALANGIFMVEYEKFKKEMIEREKNSPVHAHMPEKTEITDEILEKYAEKGRLSELAFELYKEVGCLLSVCAFSYVNDKPGEIILKRDQAICAGLLIRITKFMTAVVQLVAGDTERLEVVLALSRSIFESAINLQFLLLKNEGRFYDQFVKFSLAPEREFYDQIRRNIRDRGGGELPIETRILASIQKTCEESGVNINEINPKFRDWGGGVRNRIKALNQEDAYVSLQRIPSHAIHGTWVDLLLYHLESKEGGFSPKPTWANVDARLLAPIGVYVLEAAREYIKMFFGELPEVKPLYGRMDDLKERLLKVNKEHESWLQKESGESKRKDVKPSKLKLSRKSKRG
jgi:hypothetical protein